MHTAPCTQYKRSQGVEIVTSITGYQKTMYYQQQAGNLLAKKLQTPVKFRQSIVQLCVREEQKIFKKQQVMQTIQCQATCQST